MNRIPHGQIVSPDCQSEPPEWKNRSECQRRKVITITESQIGMKNLPIRRLLPQPFGMPEAKTSETSDPP